MTAAPAPAGRRRARPVLIAIVTASCALLGGLAVAITASVSPDNPASPTAPPQSGPVPAPEVGPEQALATTAMLQLPVQAAQPQALTTATAGNPITVPVPAITTGTWIPGGFPNTAEGALGQLTALNETALSAADPQVYARGYRELAEPGAPDAFSTGLASLLSSMRARAQLPASGAVTGLSGTYEITHGLIKGVASGGRFVVVCVLGQFSVGINGELVSLGIGDCQALRWSGTQWRIASGALAAAAPSAWPGSADAVRAGYRELVGG